MRYGIPPLDNKFLDAYQPPLLTDIPENLDILRDEIAALQDRFDNEEPVGVTHQEKANQLLAIKKKLAYKINLLRRAKNATTLEATPPSRLVTPYNTSPPKDLSILVENPIIWFSQQTLEPTPAPSTGIPSLDLAKQRANFIRTAILNPPIDRWLAALRSRYRPILAQEGDPPHDLRYYPDALTRHAHVQAHALSYNLREYGHRATVLLDFDWGTGLSTPYVVIATKVALAYLQYKNPLDIHNLHTDPLWQALTQLLPGHTEIYPLGRPTPLGPLTLGSIGTQERHHERQAMKEATAQEIRALQEQSLIFETFEIEPRLIQDHTPNWDYQIPKVVFNQDNLHYLDRALQWNSDRVRLSRDRRGARGPLYGTRIHLKQFGTPQSNQPDFIIPSTEVVPINLYDPRTRDLISTEQAFPTILSAQQHSTKVDLKGIWLL